MLTIAEKLGFVKARAVEVCTKIGFFSCTGLKTGLWCEFAGKPPQKRKILTVQVEFGEIINMKGPNYV